MKKRVYIIYTGGTIGMQPTPEGYAPAPGYLAEQIMSMPELQSDLMPEVEIQEYDPLLDSANMTPEDWHKIARDIGEHYNEYDGFIILHGTDTLTVTGEHLLHVLRGLTVPVILTGAMRPFEMTRSDALQNLNEAIFATGVLPPGVYCVAHGRVLPFPGVRKDRDRRTFVRAEMPAP